MADSARQLEGLRHCPDKRVQRAVAIAEKEMQRRDDAERKVRDLQEELAAKELAQDKRVLVVLQRDGTVEVWTKADIIVKFAHLHDLGRGNEEEAEAYMLKRLPVPYKEIYEVSGKRVASDNCRGCLSREGFRLLEIEVATIRALNAIEEATGGQV